MGFVFMLQVWGQMKLVMLEMERFRKVMRMSCMNEGAEGAEGAEGGMWGRGGKH